MNYYEILEVSVNASKEVIKNAYRALSKKYHPDTYKGDKAYAEEKLKEINTAYEVLSDENKRLLYDYDNGFKIDPNAPKEEIEVVDNDTKTTEVKVENKKKNNKYLLVIAVVLSFILAFIIGIIISGLGNKKEEKNEDKIVIDVVEKDNKDNYNYDYNNWNNTTKEEENKKEENEKEETKVEETTKEEEKKEPTDVEIPEDFGES